MTLYPNHLTAIVLSSLILGGYAWLVPDITILITYPVNKPRLSAVNSYSLNWLSKLEDTKVSDLPLFLEGSTTPEEVRFSYPGNNSNDWLTSLESGLNKLYKTLKSADPCLYADKITLSEVAGWVRFTAF